jgi:thiamine-phosphate pyrophosphorylase
MKKFFTELRGIYCFADNLPLCRKLLEGGANIIQLRDKTANDHSFARLAKDMLSLTKAYNAILIVNDRVDIAIGIGADGIHIGQEDEQYREVIRRVPENMIVGVSVDTVGQAIDAEKAGATYLGAGAVFPTPSKSDAVLIGLETLSDIVRRVTIPVAAIGGITLENIREVAQTGVRYFAIISAINAAENIGARLKEFQTCLNA